MKILIFFIVLWGISNLGYSDEDDKIQVTGNFEKCTAGRTVRNYNGMPIQLCKPFYESMEGYCVNGIQILTDLTVDELKINEFMNSLIGKKVTVTYSNYIFYGNNCCCNFESMIHPVACSRKVAERLIEITDPETMSKIFENSSKTKNLYHTYH